MLVLLLCIEGVLLTIVSSSLNTINTDQLHPTMLEKYGGISKANISERSIMNFRNFSSYFQGSYRACTTCGWINSKRGRGNFLIIQGDFVDPPYKYPWMVKLTLITKRLAGSLMSNSCGGAIINAYYVLTAAHCLVKKKRPTKYLDPKDVFVHFLTNTYQLTKGAGVKQVISHPEYDFHNHKHDIALLKLKKQIICDMYKSPLCLPPPNLKIPKGTEIKIAGWGATETGAQSQKLKEGVMKHVNFGKCTRYLAVQHLQGFAYCYEPVGHKMQDTAPGDSGSPSFYKRDGYYYAVGVTSSGHNWRSIFTAVPKYVNWITQVMSSY